MKRKIYTTRRERMTDQIIGFLAFPLVNVLLWIIFVRVSQMIDRMRSSQRIDSQELTWVPDQSWFVIQLLVVALPWLVNGIVLVLAFLLRPEFGVGYIAFIAIAIAASVVLSVLFVAACFVTILTAPVTGDLAGLLFVILLVVGLYYLADFAMQIFRSWRSSHKDTPQ